MRIIKSAQFQKKYKNLPQSIKDKTKKQLRLLLSDPQHPSLYFKKMKDPREIWEVRISYSYRLTLQILEDGYYLRTVGTHDVLKKP
ncbi:MAG: type II toxin-antitoxin system RelE/ParE family toxin [Thermodesulfobacteriota bacterium]|jgi:mRNA-degrading endonuclease RelE of RelBE toxin-antitoxin system